MSLTYTVRPISDRTWMRPAGTRQRAQFTASWSDTLALLDREIAQLNGRRVVFEMDVREQDIRLDGQVKANARPSSDAVVVAFESKHGPLQYRSDLYAWTAYGAKGQQPWQANVRAVALTLEALRKVDRYGATRSGEQYRGYKQLGAGAGIEAASMTTETARRLLRDEAHLGADRGVAADLRAARANAHPDRNSGDRSRWDAVDRAEQVLVRAGLL